MLSLWRFVWARLESRKVSSAWALVVGLAGTVIFARAVNDSYPVQDWLFWQIAPLFGWMGFYSAACLSFGQFALERILRTKGLTGLESTMLAVAVGTVAFILGMYVGGTLGLFNAGFAILLPLMMLGIGGHDGFRLLRRVLSEAKHGEINWWTWPILAFGVLLLSLVYLGAMTPDSISTDATMVHMRIAEDYARAGRLIAFPALYHACVPHLASLLFTWGFLVPGLCAAQKWMLSLHLEFCLFVWTLVGVSALVQRLAGERRIRGGWVALFLFPGIFCADSNLGAMADHVVAFFSIAIVLGAIHWCRSLSISNAVLLGIGLSGALLTKYQAVYILVPTVMVVAVVWTTAVYRRMRSHALNTPNARALLWSPVVVIITVVVVTSPHFIKNAVYHHNPVYPFMQGSIESTPSFPNAVHLVNYLYQDKTRVLNGTLSHKFWNAVHLFFSFSFEPHYFIKNTPYFGSLFTLLVPMLLFMRRRGPLIAATAIAAGSVLMWGMTFLVDRNLQTFMPILAGVTGAIIVKVWRLGIVARMGLVPIVAFQVIWGGDLPVFDFRGERIRNAMDLIATGQNGHAKGRFDRYRKDYVRLGDATPPNSKLLIHLGYDSVGIDRDLWIDRPGFQGLIWYGNLHNARELFDYYRSLGFTHVMLDAREGNPAVVQDEILIRSLLRRYATSKGNFGVYQLFVLPKQPPPVEKSYRTLALGVTVYEAGVYPIERLNTVEYLGGEWKQYARPETAATRDNVTALLATVQVVAMRRGYPVPAEFQTRLSEQFHAFDEWGDNVSLFIRN